MISLCSKTLELAETKKNFSEWVRFQLLKEDETTTSAIRWRYECEKCETAWVSKRLDNYFYCVNYMENNCSNINRLTPVQEVVE